MKKRLFVLFSVITVLLSVLFSGCSSADTVDAEKITTEFLNAVLSGDRDTARGYYGDIDSRTFNEFCDKIVQSFDGAKDFTLKQTAWSYTAENGVRYYTFTYELTTDTEKGFVVKVSFFAENDKFATLDVIPKAALSTSEVIPFKLAAFAVSCAAIGFCVWMIVDCARRNMARKWLWILIILSGFSLSVTFGYEFGMNFGLVFALPFSSVSADSLTTTIKAALPLGAIIYCILRKKITVPPVIREAQFTDITENIE